MLVSAEIFHLRGQQNHFQQVVDSKVLFGGNFYCDGFAAPFFRQHSLAGQGVLTEEWGGKTIAVEISAKQNLGIDNLLEMILLTAEVENFRANQHGKTVGTIIESRVTHGKGSTATVI